MRFAKYFFFFLISLTLSAQIKKPALISFQDQNQLFGFKNKKGKTIVPAVFNKVAEYECPATAAKKNNLWGLINGEGEELIPFQFDTLYFSQGLQLFVADKINQSRAYGNVSFPKVVYYGLINPSGKIILPVQYKEIEKISPDSVQLTKFDEWTIKNFKPDTSIKILSGEIFIRKDIEVLSIDSIPLVWDWRMPVRPGRTWGFVDSAGLMRISNRYNKVKNFSEGLAAVKLEGNWGFIDMEENLIIQPNYQFVGLFENGVCIAIKKSKYGLLNKKGKEITPFAYDFIIRGDGGFLISSKSKKMGVLDHDGLEVLATRFDKVEPQEDKRIIISRAGKKGIADMNGSILFPLEYDEIIYSPISKLYFLKKSAIQVEKSAIKNLN